jgi:hypothetical protein
MEDIGAAFVNFYQNLFTTQGALGIEECLRGLQPRVKEAMNTKLLCKFEMAEVNNELAQMHPLKSPRPDDFATCFYQQSWSTVHNDVCKAVLDFLNSGTFDADINMTNIALIPKVNHPTCITEFRKSLQCYL